MKDKAIVMMSGGMDSVTVLAHAIKGGLDCETIAFRYGLSLIHI